MVNSSIGALYKRQQSTGAPNPISFGVVVDVITDESHPKFDAVGGLIGVGSVIFQSSTTDATQHNLLPVAFPLNPNLTHFPVVGEQVVVFNSIDDASGVTTKNYYLCTVNTKNSPQQNKFDNLENKGTLANDYTPLRANPTDTVLEGRNNGSIRFSSDDKGNGLMYLGISSIPTGSQDKRQEDINGEDSVVILSSKQKVTANIPTDQPKSFAAPTNPTGSNLILPDNRVVPINNTLDDPSDFDVVPYSLIDYKAEEYEKDSLDVVEIHSIAQYEGPLTVEPNPSYDNIITTIPRRKVNIANFSSSAGKITANLPNGIKAMLDVIAFTEGTLGISHNGYDVCFGGVIIKNWSPDYKLGHPNVSQTAKGIKTSACGRYQFLHDIWTGYCKQNSAFNKNNQDIVGARLISDKRNIRGQMYNHMETYFATIPGVCQVLKILAKEWASLPYGSSEYGYYTDPLNGGKARYTQIQIQQLFHTAYALYTSVA